jgi:hypothetical protein
MKLGWERRSIVIVALSTLIIELWMKGWQEKVKGAVVILGYDGKNIHSIETPIGKLGAHRFFIYGLRSVVNGFEDGELK